MNLSAVLLLSLAGAEAIGPARAPATFSLGSTAFASNGEIPREHTCQGADVSPPLSWTGAPAGTKSFALVVEDPDAPDPAAPKLVWVHWVAYNLRETATSLLEGMKPGALPGGALDGLNDWRRPGWRGPCPPTGRHRYFFRLYALDAKLADLRHPTKAKLLEAMRGHVLASAELVGTYRKR